MTTNFKKSSNVKINVQNQYRINKRIEQSERDKAKNRKESHSDSDNGTYQEKTKTQKKKDKMKIGSKMTKNEKKQMEEED